MTDTSAVASFPERVAARATTLQPARIALTVLAAPFYLVGLVAGLIWVMIVWIASAVAVGVDDVRSRSRGRDG